MRMCVAFADPLDNRFSNQANAVESKRQEESHCRAFASRGPHRDYEEDYGNRKSAMLR